MTTEQNKLADELAKHAGDIDDWADCLQPMYYCMMNAVAALRAAGEPVAFPASEWESKLAGRVLMLEEMLRRANEALAAQPAPAESVRDGEWLAVRAVAPMPCQCCGGKLHLNGLNYTCDMQSSEGFHSDAMTLPLPQAAEKAAETSVQPPVCAQCNAALSIGRCWEIDEGVYFCNVCLPDEPAPSASVREEIAAAEVQIWVLQQMMATEDADIDFLINELRPSSDGRNVIRSFRKQIIQTAASYAADATPSPLMAAGEASGQDLKERLANPLHGTELRVETLARIEALEAQLAEVRKALAAIVALPASNRRSNMAFVQFERAKNIAAAALPKDPSTGSGARPHVDALSDLGSDGTYTKESKS